MRRRLPSVVESAANAAAATVTAAFTGAASSTLTSATVVTLSFGAGEGAEAADFGAPSSSVTVSIPAGSTSSSATALTDLSITADTIAEGDEKIDISGAAAGFVVSGAELTVVDDDLGITLTADTDSGTSGDQKTLSEDAASVGVRVRARFSSATSNDLGSAYVVRVTAAEASPQSAEGSGVDFTVPGSAVSVSIPTGTSSLQSSWVSLAGLGVVDDTIAEGSETFVVTASLPGSSSVLATTA